MWYKVSVPHISAFCWNTHQNKPFLLLRFWGGISGTLLPTIGTFQQNQTEKVASNTKIGYVISEVMMSQCTSKMRSQQNDVIAFFKQMPTNECSLY